MAKKEYLDNINTRDFYEFYRRERRKPSPKIDQYNYFVKAIHGMIIELQKMMNETEHGVHLRGLGVVYKKPFGQYYRKLTIFTHKKVNRKRVSIYLEDDYLRSKYIVSSSLKVPNNGSKEDTEKPVAVMLHRKLIKKWK